MSSFHHIPKLVLLIEFESDEPESIDESLRKLQGDLSPFANIRTKIVKSHSEIEKYWAIRHESFNLLRQRLKDKTAAPFIDDVIVEPQALSQFLPRLYKILDDNKLIYSIAGHIGNGNFHIFPLLDLKQESERKKIFEVSEQVFDLVLEYKGSHTAEHSDGLIRSPYLIKEFGEEVYNLFVKVKEIFDPEGIFNPNKKVGVSKEFAQRYLIKG